MYFRCYDEPTPPTAWTLPTVPISSHATVTLASGQAIDAVNGNTITNVRGKLALVITNTDAADDAVLTPKVSGALRDGTNTFVVIEKELTIPAEGTVIIGPFSPAYEFAGQKLVFTWVLEGSLTAGDIKVTPVLLP